VVTLWIIGIAALFAYTLYSEDERRLKRAVR
jgi:hypothetical protein